MQQSTGRLRLVPEAHHAGTVGRDVEARLLDRLDRNHSPYEGIESLVHRAHPTLAQDRLDLILADAVAQGHGRPPGLGRQRDGCAFGPDARESERTAQECSDQSDESASHDLHLLAFPLWAGWYRPG